VVASLVQGRWVLEPPGGLPQLCFRFLFYPASAEIARGFVKKPPVFKPGGLFLTKQNYKADF
jgi:hypothetical protein